MPIKLIPKSQVNRQATPANVTGEASCNLEVKPTKTEQEIDELVVATLAKITGPEGYVPASRVATVTNLSLSETVKALVRLSNIHRILRYDDGQDLWAASLKTQQDYGFVEKTSDTSSKANSCGCGSTNFWQRPDGGWVCSVCHPNPNGGVL